MNWVQNTLRAGLSLEQRLFRRRVGVLASALLLVAGAARAEFSASAVYRGASPSVVVIFGFDSAGNTSSGTGSIVTREGIVLTNHHVIFDAKTGRPYKNIRVVLKPERVTGDVKIDLKDHYSVRVVSRDESLDLALLQILGAPKNLSVLPLGDSEHVDVGTSVAAIGHPGGGGLWTLTTGTISSRRRDGTRDVFQTDAAINPGNSGGPLLDGQANLIGINTFVRRVNKQGLPLEGLNYSLRSSLARNWMASRGVQVAMAEPVADRYEAPAAPSQPAPAPRSEPAAEPQWDTPPAPTPAPTPTTPESAPQMRNDPPTVKDEPREFTGPRGERMYGVPDRDFTLKKAGRVLWQKVMKNAEGAFDDLDSEF
jgi:serine protease Do